MESPTKKLAITLGILLLSFASNVRSQDFNSSVYLRFANSPDLLSFGTGSEPEYLPAIVRNGVYDPFAAVECTIYTRERGKCQFTRRVSEGTVDAILRNVHQLSKETVAVAWFDSVKNASGGYEHRTKVTMIDMPTCSSREILDVPRAAEVLFYKNSLDVIYPGKPQHTRANYDLTGTKVDESEFHSFGTNFFFRLFPVSSQYPSKGFFYYKYIDEKHKLSLVDVHGKEIKKLVDNAKKDEQLSVTSHSNDSARAFCWISGSSESLAYECRQYDQRGEELWKNRTDCKDKYVEPRYVRNLKGGGVLLLALDYVRNKMDVIEMQAGRDVAKSTHSIYVWNMEIMDFDEADRSFAVVVKSTDSKDAIISRYDFPRKPKSTT